MSDNRNICKQRMSDAEIMELTLVPEKVCRKWEEMDHTDFYVVCTRLGYIEMHDGASLMNRDRILALHCCMSCKFYVLHYELLGRYPYTLWELIKFEIEDLVRRIWDWGKLE